MSLVDAAIDLLFAGVCPGCELPGKGLCRSCFSSIMAGSVCRRHRAGVDLPLWSAGDYVDPLTSVITRAKEHRRWDAIDVLGLRLGFAVAGLADEAGLSGDGVLVPFPSQAATIRARGLDVTRALAEAAARHLGRIGLDAEVRRLLRHVRPVKDQGSLTSRERCVNLEGSLRAVGRPGRSWVVLVDDVVTTGSSLREGIRALRAAGCHLDGSATVAATSLRASIR